MMPDLDMRTFPDPRTTEQRARVFFEREVLEIPEGKNGKVCYPLIDGVPRHPDPQVEAMRVSALLMLVKAAARTLPANGHVGDSPVLILEALPREGCRAAARRDRARESFVP